MGAGAVAVVGLLLRPAVRPAGCEPLPAGAACLPCILAVAPAHGVSLLFLACDCSVGGGAGGQVAKDALGNDVKKSTWLKTHPIGDRSLTQGLKVGVAGFCGCCCASLAGLQGRQPYAGYCCGASCSAYHPRRCGGVASRTAAQPAVLLGT